MSCLFIKCFSRPRADPAPNAIPIAPSKQNQDILRKLGRTKGEQKKEQSQVLKSKEPLKNQIPPVGISKT